MVLLAASMFVEFVRHRSEPEQAARLTLRVAVVVLALALLPKMALNTRLFHYGFVLAMPATLVLIVALVDWLPARVERSGGDARVVRAVALGALVAAILAHLAFMQKLLVRKVDVVGRGVDAIYADDRGRPIGQLLDQIRTRVGATETLIALPEGVMLNYLAR